MVAIAYGLANHFALGTLACYIAFSAYALGYWVVFKDYPETTQTRYDTAVFAISAFPFGIIAGVEFLPAAIEQRSLGRTCRRCSE